MHAEFEAPVQETSIEIKVSKPTTVSKSADSNVYKAINGVSFYKKNEAVYKQYKKGDIMIALDMNDKGAKSFALLPNTLAAQTLIMSFPKEEHSFYDVCIYSSKYSIRNYPVKLFFDIEEKDEDGKRQLFTMLHCNVIVSNLYMNVCEVLKKYYAIGYDFKDVVVINSGMFMDDDEFEGYTHEDKQVAIKEKYGNAFSSFHVVFNKIHFCNIKSMSDFFETHKKILVSKGLDECIDQGVYTRSRNFCLPECTKKGQERYLKIISHNHDFQYAMLPAISDDSVIIPTTKKDLEKIPTTTISPTPETITSMEKEFLDNIALFTDDATAEYMC